MTENPQQSEILFTAFREKNSSVFHHPIPHMHVLPEDTLMAIYDNWNVYITTTKIP